MTVRLSSLFLLVVLFVAPTVAKDKKRSSLPEYVLQARTVVVVIDPDAGEPLDKPHANVAARENVEKALTEWGRFDLLTEGHESDLVIVVRAGNGKTMRPTMKGGPVDRSGGWDTTDSSVRIGSRQAPSPSLNDPNTTPPNRAPHISNEIGPADDTFDVYRGDVKYPLDSLPVWRYIAKDCLSAPKVTAVEEFRKAIAEAEKPQPQKP